MVKVNFMPAIGYILIDQKKAERKTAGGIIVPDNANQEDPFEGTVVAINEDAPNQGIEVGHKVYFQRFRGQQVTLPEGTFVCLEIEDGYLGRIPKDK